MGFSHGVNMAGGSRVTTGRVHTQHVVPLDNYRGIQEIPYRSQVRVDVKLETGNERPVLAGRCVLCTRQKIVYDRSSSHPYNVSTT